MKVKRIEKKRLGSMNLFSKGFDFWWLSIYHQELPFKGLF